MLLKNQMEDKKLNFNQPFLSVRRYAPTATSRRSDERKTNNPDPVVPRLPHHRSELKSGPIRNPGAVPFLWEQTPGQPKEETKPEARCSGRPPVAPKLPPGRYPKANQQGCHNVSSCADDNNRNDVDVTRNSHSAPSHDYTVEKFESSKETAENEKSDSDDSDGAYVDALDTLSRTESFFLNCSMSGLSGLDDSDVKLSRSFSTDVQIRKFMMDRFLPAAKAMTSETPQYAPKKQAVVQEQTQQLKKVVNQYKPSLRYGPSFAKRYSIYHDNAKEEEEESDDDYDQRGYSPAVCGLIPQFCLKRSFCLFNHVPAMSVRTRVPMSTANNVRPRSSPAGSLCETEIKKDVAVPEEKQQAGIEGFRLHGKGLRTFEELLADQSSPKESNSGAPVIEKTLYVDTVQSVESPNSRSYDPLSAQDTKGVPSSREEDHEIITKWRDQIDAIDSSLEEDFKKLNSSDVEEKMLLNSHELSDFNILSSIEKSAEESRMEMTKAFQENEDCKLDSTIAGNVELTEKEAITLENCYHNYYQLPIPPPLPKSPSDSWLWRTLPSMSTKNSSLHSYHGATAKPQNQVSKDTESNTKWETIVKTTKVRHRHLQYSEDSLTTISET